MILYLVIKQRGEEARQADNLFHYLTYGVPDNHISTSTQEYDEQLSLETQISEFGQVPKQVERLIKEDSIYFYLILAILETTSTKIN